MFGKLEQKRAEVKRLRDLQRDSIVDEYMAGLYNGLELALSALEEREPEMVSYTTEPDVVEEEEEIKRTVASGILRRE